MKQDDKSGNSDGGQDGVMSGAALKESISSGDANDAQSAVSGSEDGLPSSGSGGELRAADPARNDSTADSTSHELNTSANTSGSSQAEESSSCSETAEGTAMIGRSSENEREHSISSCNDSVSESNQGDSLSSNSGTSIQSGAIDKSGRNSENNEIDQSHLPSEAVSNLDDRQAETADESLSESSPRDSFTSSVTSTPSGLCDRSGRNSGASDTDHSPSETPSATAPSSDERQAGETGDTLTAQDTTSQDAGSESADKIKMTLRSGKVTQAESVVPKKMQKKSSARATKRRCSVDQGNSSSEENPDKLLRLESTETSTVQDSEYRPSFVNNPSGDRDTSSPLPTKSTGNDAPLHEASDTTPDEQEEAVMGNEKPEDEKLDAKNSEVTPDNDLNSAVNEELLDQTSTNSESSAYQSADNVTGTDSLSRTDVGGDEDLSFCSKLEVPDKPEFNAPSGSTSGVSTEDIKETQTGGRESRTSQDSESSSDENEFAVNCARECMDCEYESDPCDDYYEDCSVEAVDNALKTNFFHAFTDNSRSGFRQMSPDVPTTPWKSAAVDTNSEHSLTRRLIPTSESETNAPLDAEEYLRGERMQPVSQAIQHCEAQVSTAVPDSSTEETVGEIAPSTDTNMQQQMPSNISQSLDADAATDEQINCESPHRDGLLDCTKQVNDDLPHEDRNTAASVAQGTGCKTAEDVPQDTGDLQSPVETQFEERNLRIYRYINSGSSDVRFSPYVTRRRPLRSGYASEGNYQRIFIRGHRREARQTDDNALQTPSGGQFKENCCIS